MSTKTWKVEIPGDVIADETGHAVAVAYRPPFGSDDWKANAKLIAAAPDLQAALRFALDVLNADCHLGGDYHTVADRRFPPATCPACKAEAALAKARGES